MNPLRNDWLTFRTEWGAVHVIPCCDTRPHTDKPECWCEPEVTAEGVWVHNSQDGREQFEHKRRLVS